MKKRNYIYALIISCMALAAVPQPVYSLMLRMSAGPRLGLVPSMGGDLNSRVQEVDLGVTGGIEGINRSKDGLETERIKRLFGASAGAGFRAVFADYLLFSTGADFSMDFFGGEGSTLDSSDNIVTAEYSMLTVGIPVTLGFSIPFWNDIRISFSGGVAPTYGIYKNSFSSAAPLDSSATFRGWGVPMIIVLTGEYLLTKKTGIVSSLTWCNGSTRMLKGGQDYARIDFSGYRWNIGMLFYFNTRIELKEKLRGGR